MNLAKSSAARRSIDSDRIGPFEAIIPVARPRCFRAHAAHAAARTKGTYLAAQYKRIAARRGAGRAAVAVGHSILVIVYHLLRDGIVYQDLGATWFDERDRSATVRRTVRRLEVLGYRVTLEAASLEPSHALGFSG